MERFEHVPTPPQDGSTREPGDATVLTHRAIGDGGFWPAATSSSDPDLHDCDDD